MIETPEIGETVIVMKGAGEGGTVIGFWQDAMMDIEWVVLRRHVWIDGGWNPTEDLVPL